MEVALGVQSNFRGNPQHLAYLIESARRGDISLWNSYARKMGATTHARLAGASLRDLSLGEANLMGADLRDADMSGANLTRANLAGAKLQGASLVGTNFRGARLDHCDFSNSNLSRANLVATDLCTAIFTDATLRGTNGIDEEVASISDSEPNKMDSGMSPWILALKEEIQRKKLRLTMEKEQAAVKRRRLNRKLGRRRPLFRKVK